MNFWIFAITLLIVSAAIVGWPLFTGSVKDKITGLFILLMLPLAGLMMYQSIGTPEAINLPPAMAAQQSAEQQSAHSTQQGQMDELVASLQQRMIENPDDPEGWVILGRSLKTMQRYAEAETALSNANRLVPDNPSIMVELAETMLFTSGQPEVTGEARELIEAALAIDPDQQKGLWIMGMALAQEGEDAQALAYWQRLLGQIDPASEPYQNVSQQIRLAQTRLGQPEAVKDAVVETVAEAPKAAMPPVAAPVTTKPAATPPAGFGIPTTITLGEGVTESFPPRATLFIFIHPAGGAGMPLAVKRLAPQDFPMSLNFTDADLLQPGGSLQAFDLLDISARISMAGVANVASGDIQANRVTVNTKNVSAIALHLDQRVP